MRSNFLKASLKKAALLGAAVLLVASTSFAADVYLAAQGFTKTLPGGSTVPMWGFALCADNTFTACTNPAPPIMLPEGEPLTIYLKNELPTPVSLVIPGQAGGGNPTFTRDARGRARVQSFTTEVGPGATGSYTWSSLRAGTYLYQSGTYPSIQVPMGLYGALIVGGNAADQVLLFSEIDPIQNAAVGALATAAGLAGTTINPASYPSTKNYSPAYFLINGVAFDESIPGASTFSVPWTTGDPAPQFLVRFLNAGLRSHTPSIVGLDMGLMAEDGNLYPGVMQKQSAVLLAAGKTLDVLIQAPAANATYPIFDRMLDLTNNNQPKGGMLAYLVVGGGSQIDIGVLPNAVDDAFAVVEDTPFTGNVLANDAGLVNARLINSPTNGTVILNADGSFTYTPNPDYSGQDIFTYVASNGIDDSRAATVTLAVSFVNDPPVGAADGPYVNVIGANLNVAAPGVLGNDRDADGDVLTAVLEGPAPAGLTLNLDGSFSYTGVPGTFTFSYRALDAVSASSAPTTVTFTVNPVSNVALTVTGPEPTDVVSEYHWVLEEDTTWHPDPAVIGLLSESLGTNFHKSYMPVVAQGCVGVSCSTQIPFSTVALDPAKHYFVSVLPADAASGTGHTVGAAQLPPGAASVNVIVNRQPIPTAQISVLIFEDSHPTNGAPDENEPGLGGFQITLEDPAGRYGANGGPMSQDAFGNMLVNALDCAPAPPFPGAIVTCPDGRALIKNLAPGKYGVTAVPPAGAPVRWVQTSTIEGTRVIDAWVKAGEPAYFQEFGPPGFHVFIGFLSPDRVGGPVGGTNTVSGRVTNLHMSRPPNQTLWDSNSRDALGHTTAWVGLNSANGIGLNIAAIKADDQGNFQIGNVPDGTYQLVVWDEFVDQIIAYRSFTLPGGGNLGNVPVFNWFARLENHVFLDENRNGIRDATEMGMAEQAVNIRFRDGTIYQVSATDMEGFVPFDEVFPFFNWLVAEVDYARHMPTGVTVTVDNGGDAATAPTPLTGVLSPQVQADGAISRVETGPVLTQAFQGFLGQTSVIEWGKAPYLPGENGGISGIVYYASTRAENDPRLGVGDTWEPGVPSVKVRLYREVATAAGGTSLALVAETQTDSWDASNPTNCPVADPTDPLGYYDPLSNSGRCYDGIRNFNQIRPGVFDGGYAFNGIPAGKYIVEVVPPPGYELVKEEDINVGFGDAYIEPVPVVMPNGALIAIMPDQAMVASTLLVPGINQPACVGPERIVPANLSLFPTEAAPFAGAPRPLCNRKEVLLADRSQAAADFYLFTFAPIAGHFTGMILNDLAQEFNVNAPSFGEKWAPPFVPVAIRDFSGREIGRVYSDQWGRFNGLVPSTFTANLPQPSGFSPNMLMTCMNDPGPIPGPGGALIRDPNFNPMFSNFCYTFQYMPGTTTYLDTPVLPTAAFASGYNPVDCAFPDGTPVVRQVDGDGVGPFLNPNTGGLTLTITAKGPATVPNPYYEGPEAPAPYNQKSITRDYGFGTTAGTVTLGGMPLVVTNWSSTQITAQVPPTAGTAQLVVTRGDNGRSTVNSVTVTVAEETPVRVAPGGSIQAAIDAAAPGSLILVSPGTYEELVVMWKPVRLQGAGADSTLINAAKFPTEKLQTWRNKVDSLFNDGLVDTLPGQEVGGLNLIEPDTLGTEEGPGITVLARADDGHGRPPADGFRAAPSRIDGFGITGGDTGGGIFVNGWAHGLEISNNDVFSNSSPYHGGIRVGRPFLETLIENLLGDGPFGFNQNLSVHHNAITQNGGLNGAGGGLSLCTGTDNYVVQWNFICGNFSSGHGAGIGHLGLSEQGVISHNTILFNESYNQGVNQSGGGIFVGGEPAVGAGLTLGSGSVTIDSNLIQGNYAGAGHGGGIRTQQVNGADVARNRNQPNLWHQITITNNMIVNNVAGWSGGGISLQDTAVASITSNTIAHNDSTATVGTVFTVGPNTSAPQIAGISSERHSAPLAAAFGPATPVDPYRVFSNPALSSNIIWQNRSFYYDGTTTPQLMPALSQSQIGECPAGASYWDLGIIGEPALRLNPTSSILTNTTGYDPSNISDTPPFATPYCNGPRTLRIFEASTTLEPLPALDEGGNWIDVRWGPLMLMGNYAIAASLSANPTSLVFPDTFVDRRSDVQVVTLTNNGFWPVLLSRIEVPQSFTQSNDCGSSLARNASCRIEVTFAPAAAGAYSGNLAVYYGGAAPLAISLSGTAVERTVGPGPAAPTQGFAVGAVSPTTVEVQAGQTATYALNVATAPTFSGQIAFACTGAPSGATCLVTPETLTVAPGGRADVLVNLITAGTVAAGIQGTGNSTPGWPGSPVWPGAVLGMLVLLSVWPLASARRLVPAVARVACVALLAAASMFLISCGGGSSRAQTTSPVVSPTAPVTPPGTHVLTVTAKSGSFAQSVKLTVNVR
jgi:FtsP/CotA-like multicopper oxidase with cupredoxin domain